VLGKLQQAQIPATGLPKEAWRMGTGAGEVGLD